MLPSDVVYVPALQGMQDAISVVLYVPAPHASQVTTLAADVALYVPALHTTFHSPTKPERVPVAPEVNSTCMIGVEDV